MTTTSPQRFGRYVVVRPLGRGAVGEVYLARDPKLDRMVAVKTLSGLALLPAGEQDEARERFLREARAAAALNHPNIVTIFDVGEQDGLPYIAMEYLEGTTLDRYTQPGHLLPVQKVLEIGIRAALALDEAHRAGLVHRDVKPANLVLLSDGTVKVADFGLAKDPRAAMTSDQSIVGTPNYMSPEQIAGRSLDGRSDLFSLAVSLFELLAGERPFTGDTVSTVLYRVVNESPPSLRALRDEAPEPLESLLETMLAKKREERVPSGREFATRLRAILTDLGGVPEQLELPQPATARGARVHAGVASAQPAPSRRRRRRWLVALVPLLALAALAGAWTAPAWSGADPLGAARASVEQWLVRTLGTTGEMLVVGGLDSVVEIETVPAGLPFVVASGEGVETDPEGNLVVASGATGTIELAVDAPCRVGSATVDASAPPASLVIETSPLQFTLGVATSPAGAAIVVDGRETGAATPTEIELEACREHVVELTRSGRAPTEIVLAADGSLDEWKAALADVELSPPDPGWLEIPRAPYSVRVRLARGRRSLGPAGQRLQLGPGRYRILLEAPEVLFSREITTTVRTGETTAPSVEYPPVGALSVRAVPPGGDVTVRPEGGGRAESIGETPLIGRRLVAGTYDVIVTHPTRGVQVSRTAVVAGGGEPTVVVVGAEAWP